MASYAQVIIGSSPQSTAPESEPHSAGTSRGPISIIGDYALSTADCVRSGDGSAGNPYVIAGWDINMTGQEIGPYTGNGIFLSSLSLYVVVANCTVKNADIAIYISFCNNATITNNTCTDSVKGISASSCNNITITNNTCSNTRWGIELNACDDSHVVTNYLAFNTHAIYLQGNCNSCTISSNVIEYYVGLLYGGTLILDKSTGTNNISDTNNTLLPNYGGVLNTWTYFCIACVGASTVGFLLVNKLKKRQDRQRTSAGSSWQSSWRAQSGIALAELGLWLALPCIFIFERDIGGRGAGILAVLYAILQYPYFDYILSSVTYNTLAEYTPSLLIPALGICVQLLLVILSYRIARRSLAAELPKKMEAWELKDLVRKVSIFSLGGFAATIITGIMFVVSISSQPCFPMGILYVLPGWVLGWQAHRKGEMKFKAECVAQFRAKPDQAFAASLDLEFEAWAAGGKKGKVETLPREIVQAPPVPAVKAAPGIQSMDSNQILLWLLLQSNVPNKITILESYKQDLIDAFKLGISRTDAAGLNGEALVERFAQVLRERVK